MIVAHRGESGGQLLMAPVELGPTLMFIDVCHIHRANCGDYVTFFFAKAISISARIAEDRDFNLRNGAPVAALRSASTGGGCVLDFPTSSGSARRRLGDAFLAEGRVLALLIPSVIVPAERNAILNPLHPAMADVRVVADAPFRFDPRLLRR